MPSIDIGTVVGTSSALPAGVNSTYFYCRITGFLIPAVTGSYVLGVNCQDGCSLFIGAQEKCLIENIDATDVANGTAAYTTSSKINLTAGQFYPFIIEWQCGASGAPELQFLWTPPGVSVELVPGANLSDVAGAISQAVNVSYWNGSETMWYPTGDGQTPITTEGDLILGAAGGIPTRLPIGAAGQVLTADGTTASWQAAGGSSATFGSGAPSGSASTGALYFDTSTTPYTLYVYNGGWQEVGGSGGGGGAGGWTSGNNGNGYWVNDPSGTLRQWGVVTTDINGGTVAVTFPTAFSSSTGISVDVSTKSSTDRITYVVDGSVSTTGFTIGNNGSGGYAYWEAVGPGTVSGGGGGGGGSDAFPLDIVQECQVAFDNSTSFTLNFPQASAASGNTLFMLIGGCDGVTLTPPPGWTIDVDQSQSLYSRVVLMHKTSAGDTSATFTTSGAADMGVWFFEAVGSRALDQCSSGGVANTAYLPFPAITPTAGALVIAAACLTVNNPLSWPIWPVTAPADGNWKLLTVWPYGIHGHRTVQGFVRQIASDGTAITPPLLDLFYADIYPGAGVAYATFSIL